MENSPTRLNARSFGGVLVGLATLAFMLLWSNNWLGLTNDGWYLFYGHQLLDGKLPYRDFSLVVPPLHIMELAALIGVFGERLLAVHLFGVLQRVALAVVVFRWLSGLYGRRVAALASVTMVVLSSGDIADTVCFYHHDAAFWAVVAGWSASVLIRRTEAGDERAGYRFAALSGAAGALCFLIKQTAGLAVAVTLAIVLGAILSRAASGRVWRRTMAAYGGGWCVPVVLMAFWLAARKLTGAFLDSVFGRGTASKGALFDVLSRPLVDSQRIPELALAAMAALICVVAAAMLARQLRSRQRSLAQRWPLGLALLLLMALFGRTLASGHWLPPPRLARIWVVYMAVFVSFWLLSVLLLRWWRRNLDREGEQRLVLAAVSAALAYAFSLSWAAWELMLVPSLGLLIGEAMRASPVGAAARPWRLVVAACCLLGVISTTRSKLQVPYAWGEWREPPVSQATVGLNYPLLAGFRLSPSTARFVDTLTRVLTSYSRPGEGIFIFPNMPLFYMLSDRPPVTTSYAQWFDITPDYVAIQDAQTLLRVRPAVIVDYQLSEQTWRSNELRFRGGAPSGQRQLAAAVARLAASADYERVAEFPAPLTGNRLRVWARIHRELTPAP